MSRETEPTTLLSERLRSVFDRHVLNYGAYNLVYTTGISRPGQAAESGHRTDEAGHFIVGYRRVPSEIVVVPMNPREMESTGVPVSIDNTNLIEAKTSDCGAFSLETTSGALFDLNVSPLTEVDTIRGREVLEQEADQDDFLSYLRQVAAA